MTEQNTAYNSDLDSIDESDPLAELARIVSGESMPQKAEPTPIELEVVESAPADSGFDIESELLKELGDAPGEAANSNSADVVEFEISDDDFAAELQAQTTEVVQSEPQATSADDVLSLEDQLMAELESGSGNEAVIEQVSEADTLVDETVSNAMRDVEMASEGLAREADPFEQVEQLTAEIQREAAQEVAGEAVEVENNTVSEASNVDEFFAEGFEDLLQEEMAASAEVESADVTAQEPDFDFGEAFAAEIEAREPAIQGDPAVSAPVSFEQDELALENDFAKAFADELSGDEPGIAVGPEADFDPQIAAVPAINEPYVSAQEQVEPDSVAIAPEVAAASGSSNGFKLAVGALVCALAVGLGVVGWGYYSGQDSSSEPTIVKADTQPAKIKPDDPGGEEIANQNNEVYNQVAGNTASEPKQEELISSRQQPVEVQPKADNRLAPGSENTTAETAPLGLSPKRVKTLTVKPDGTIISSEGEVAKVAEPDTAANTDTSQTPVAVSASAETDTGTIGIDGAETTGSLAIPEPSPLPAAREVATATPAPAAPKPVASTPKPAAAPAADENAPTQIASLDNSPAPTPVVTSSEWKIQVSSQRSREAAESSFKNLQRRFSSILGGRSAVIQRADIDGKGTFYRAKVLAESKTEASRLCTRLKSAGGSCFVTR